MATNWMILLLLIRILDAFVNTCDPSNLVQIGKERNDTYYVFVITQDCEVVVGRADQLIQFKGLAVDIRQHISYCLPNLIQLHWQGRKSDGNLSLKLVFKRANNQICVLPIDFPTQNALVGGQLFRYSLLNSLTYAVCSYMPNSTFVTEPELSFMDSVYSDVIYFVDPKSAGSFWTIRQFKIDSIGYLKSLETFVVKNFAEESDFASRTANEYLLALDSQRIRLYSVHKLHKDVSQTCAYDLLFRIAQSLRPHKARIQRYMPSRQSPSSFRLSSYSVDKNITLFVESQRNNQNNGFQSRVFLAERHVNYSSKCLLELPYALKVEIISGQSLDKFREKQLPKFEEAALIKSQKTSPFGWLKTLHSTTTLLKASTSVFTSPVEEATRPSVQEQDDDVVDESLIDDEATKITEQIDTPDDNHQHLTEEEMGIDDNEVDPDYTKGGTSEPLQNNTDVSFSSPQSKPITMLLITSLSILLL